MNSSRCFRTARRANGRHKTAGEQTAGEQTPWRRETLCAPPLLPLPSHSLFRPPLSVLKTNARTGRPEFPIFPAKGTHNQLMGIDDKLKGRDANEPAPGVARRNVWLGDNLGWENNRGLKATRPEFEDGRVEKWPNPKNWDKHPAPLWG